MDIKINQIRRIMKNALENIPLLPHTHTRARAFPYCFECLLNVTLSTILVVQHRLAAVLL